LKTTITTIDGQRFIANQTCGHLFNYNTIIKCNYACPLCRFIGNNCIELGIGVENLVETLQEILKQSNEQISIKYATKRYLQILYHKLQEIVPGITINLKLWIQNKIMGL